MKKFIIILAFILPLCFSLKGYCAQSVDSFFDSSSYGSVLLVKGGNVTYIFYTFSDDVLSINGNQISSNNHSPYGYRVDNGYTIGNILYGISIGIATPVEIIRYKNVNGVPTSDYDDSVGVGSEFFIVQQGNAFDTQKWGIFWKTPNCSSCQLMISGGIKTDSFDVDINSSLWINPSDYATDNSNIVLFLTPLDSSGNWGNTMSISHYYHSNLLTQGVENAIQLFQGYIAKADNIPETNIIGIDTVDVVDYSGRPGSSGTIDTTTKVNTTTFYSPVYNTTSNTVNNVFNEYITNETVYNSVTNNYYITNNYINNTTNLSIDLGGGDSDSKENLLIKFLNSRKWFNDTSDEVLNSLKDLKGTPFEFIFDTVSTCLVALVGIAVVLLLVKVVGFFV